MRLLVLNGPNLNMLGVREPEIYGRATLGDIEELCRKTACELGAEVDCRQSNLEGELVTWIQQARETCRGIILNAGAYTHTSVAILDALKIAALPTIEVHISNVFAREAFRQHSYISAVAAGVICGLGVDGYACAIRHLVSRLQQEKI
ncbi:MAG: type II 3-dehydroquinate dehydratase [Alphaproteobacteria bacterium]|nr:type II 3-dehydroquinate dehydratase [Alphaproteobacteria bacterium]